MPAVLADRLASLAPTGVGVGPYARSIILDHLAALTPDPSPTPAPEPKDTP